MFSKYFDVGETVPWKNERYLTYDAVTFSNRYFSNVSGRSYMQGVSFTPLEDPFGKLSGLSRESGLRHCEDNVVKYFILQNGRYAQMQFNTIPEDKFN
jgi:hypothetical protein